MSRCVHMAPGALFNLELFMGSTRSDVMRGKGPVHAQTPKLQLPRVALGHAFLCQW